MPPRPTPASLPASTASTGAPLGSDEAQTMRRVLSDLQRQVDLSLEVRLRELLAPMLSRIADT
ncbi:MAG TPA: hypothetical protein VFF72_06740, partial [Caldimonas sp.]|nr:hypothetical protein [Caldimonas sp.]